MLPLEFVVLDVSDCGTVFEVPVDVLVEVCDDVFVEVDVPVLVGVDAPQPARIAVSAPAPTTAPTVVRVVTVRTRRCMASRRSAAASRSAVFTTTRLASGDGCNLNRAWHFAVSAAYWLRLPCTRRAPIPMNTIAAMMPIAMAPGQWK
ncbi:MAG TPA: hypothetical protein VG650_04010 [Mycobacteriales bacterium]|nr:hypothetical protein [Mycobacteriales bacterium]